MCVEAPLQEMLVLQMQYRENMKTAPLARVKQKGSAKMGPVDKRGKRQRKEKKNDKEEEKIFFKKKDSIH